MKHTRTFRAFLTAALMAGLAGVASAQAMMASGKIASIDPGQSMIKLRTGLFATQEFKVESDTKITDGQQPLDLEQLQPGTKATVEYVQENGKRVAQSVTIESAGAAPAPAATEPSTAAPESAPATATPAEPATSGEPVSPEGSQAPAPAEPPAGGQAAPGGTSLESEQPQRGF